MKIHLIFLLMVLFTSNVWGWEETETHPTLSDIAAGYYFDPIDTKFLSTPLTINNETLPAYRWLRRGSIREDDGTKIGYVTGTARSLYHFHDPTKALGLGGLSDMPLPQKMSTPLWAQNTIAQTAATGGDWSWGMVRTHHYNYLTAVNKTDSDANLARTLMGLGYQLHLIQDMSQPNHVRNDTHMDDGMANKPINGFETWARFHPDSVALILGSNDAQLIINSVAVDLTKEFINTVDGSKIAPVARLFDTRDTPGQLLLPSRSLSQGLAEYTNTNFFSEDTTFAAQLDLNDKHYYAYPSKGETTVQQFIDKNLPAIPFFDFDKTYLNFRISKPADQTLGEPLNCMAKPGPNTAKYYKLLGEGKFFYGSFMQDDECFFEQASKLFPRAVGYSKAMLDYFFRGKLEIEPVTSASTFQHFFVKIKNSTATGEEMTGGDLALVIKYRLQSETGGVVAPPAESAPYYYKVVNLPGQYAVSRTQQSELTFDLGSDPLPFFATDVTLQVVYRGQLGNEAGSVAVGTVPLTKTGTDIALSLPASGVYTTAAPNASGFTRIAVNAMSASDLNQPDGYFELLVKYRTAASDPFQGVPVESLPPDYRSFSIIRATEASGITSLPQGTTRELVFNLPTPLPLWATDVYLDVVYRRTSIADEKPLAIGHRDISEPTPVDLFNNADKVCVNGAWHDAGTPDTLALRDAANNLIADYADLYAHDIGNIFYKASAGASVASSGNYTYSSPAILAGNSKRTLGYILTDYSFNYSLLEDWFDADPADPWYTVEPAEQYAGTAVKNQTDAAGNYSWPSMFTIRGKSIWWGAGVVYDNNNATPQQPDCSWAALP